MSLSVVAQNEWSQKETSIIALAKEVTSIEPSTQNRLQINETLVDEFSTLIKEHEVFDNTFESLKPYLSILDADELRIFSWQIMITEDKYEYHGFIWQRDQPHEVIWLDDVSDEVAMTEVIELYRADWFGSYLYNMLPFKTEDSTQVYILFGYNANDRFSNKKIIDVLHLNDNGEVTFGYPLFFHDDGPKYRRVFDIDATASIRVNYDADLEIIIFSHLIAGGAENNSDDESALIGYQINANQVRLAEVKPTETDDRPAEGRVLMRPDGSYQGYKLIDGRWTFVDKIFNHVLDTPPRPKPIFKDKPNGH